MSLKKKLKKLRKKASKVVKKAGKALGTALRVAAPVAALVIPGAQGIAIAAGAGIAGSALKGGSRKKKLKALKRTGINVGLAVGGKAALGAVSGLGVGSSVLSSVPKIVGSIFGGGAPAPKDSLDDAFIEPADVGAGSGSALENAIGLGASVLSGGGPGGIGAGMPGQTINPDMAGERGGGPFGDSAGFDASASGEGGGISPLMIALGVGALLLVMSRKK